MNERFPVLSTVSSLLTVFGWLVVGAGILYGVYYGVYEPTQGGYRYTGMHAFQLIIGMVVGLVGLLTVAFSEVIGVLFAIEKNTRTSCQ